MGWTHQWFSSVFEVKDLVGAKEVPHHAHHTMTRLNPKISRSKIHCGGVACKFCPDPRWMNKPSTVFQTSDYFRIGS